MDRSCPRALAVLAVIVAGCGTVARPTFTAGHTQPAGRPFALGKPLAPRAVEVAGIPGTVELRAEDPGMPASPSVFVTLGRTVAREPNDVCFATYIATENPEEGEVSCQVRGTGALILTLEHGYIPYASPASRFTRISGQVSGNVARVRLIGPGATDASLPLSAHRMFLVAFSPAARGTYQLLARLAGGTSFAHAFTLPLTDRDAGAWPGLRRRGAVFGYGLGENILKQSYRQILKQFGPPLKTFIEPPGVRCIYYDVVGYKNGWRFCFKGQAMVGATGEYPPPAGIR